jgi:SAM-dependent methyltransferase
MQELPAGSDFDGAFCFGNSFGYGSEEEDQKFLETVHGALRPGARFALDTKSAETIFPRFQERQWFEAEGITMLCHDQYDPLSGRIDSEYTFIANGKVEKRSASEIVYTYREIVAKLQRAGFGEIQAYGSHSFEPLRLGAERLLIVAVRC